MKRSLLLLLALTVALTAAACSKEDHTHEYTAAVTKQPTCTTSGVLTYTCSCGDSYTSTLLPAGHNWSDWEDTLAPLVGRFGTETRTCADCSETQSQEVFDGAAENAFLDQQLQWFMWGDAPGLGNSEMLLTYVSQKYEGREDLTVNLTSTTVFDYLSVRFDLTDDLKAKMKQDERYDPENDTFSLTYQADFAEATLLGYVCSGDDRYTAYYSIAHYGTDISTTWRVDLEYNLLDDLPNRYLSVTRAENIPDDIITGDT